MSFKLATYIYSYWCHSKLNSKVIILRKYHDERNFRVSNVRWCHSIEGNSRDLLDTAEYFCRLPQLWSSPSSKIELRVPKFVLRCIGRWIARKCSGSIFRLAWSHLKSWQLQNVTWCFYCPRTNGCNVAQPKHQAEFHDNHPPQSTKRWASIIFKQVVNTHNIHKDTSRRQRWETFGSSWLSYCFRLLF